MALAPPAPTTPCGNGAATPGFVGWTFAELATHLHKHFCVVVCALDVAAGIGRVSGATLLTLCDRVDVQDGCGPFIDQARKDPEQKTLVIQVSSELW